MSWSDATMSQQAAGTSTSMVSDRAAYVKFATQIAVASQFHMNPLIQRESDEIERFCHDRCCLTHSQALELSYVVTRMETSEHAFIQAARVYQTWQEGVHGMRSSEGAGEEHQLESCASGDRKRGIPKD